MARRPRAIAQVSWSPDREAAIKRAVKLVRDAAEPAVRESAQFVLGRELQTVPVDTGRTRAGLSIEDVDEDGLFASEVAERDPLRAHVAFFLNRGTKNMPATHFADNAVAAERRRMVRRVTRHVKGRLGGD